MKPPFRADHVGSLLRPQELHEARASNRRGEIDAAALKAVQDRCIKDAIALQESIGLQAVTDGEFRRDWWHIDFLHGFDGVELAKGDAYGDAKFKGTDEQPPFMLVQGRIRRCLPAPTAPRLRRPTRASTTSGPTSRKPTGRRSGTSTRQDAATCRSTTPPSP
jgi:methionine synthase II (cobalamin-independent)